MPKWYDEHGVPRVAEFHPSRCDVYVDYVALLEVECQACGRLFRVAQSVNVTEERIARGDVKWQPVLPSRDDVGSFHYGDPPMHYHLGERCIGDSMNTLPRRVLQFWHRNVGSGVGWVRCPEYELEFSEFPFGFAKGEG